VAGDVSFVVVLDLYDLFLVGRAASEVADSIPPSPRVDDLFSVDVVIRVPPVPEDLPNARNRGFDPTEGRPLSDGETDPGSP
jgi:hypothetical protein